MMNKSKLTFILPLILFVGVVAFLATRLDKQTQVDVNTATNQTVPAFNLPLLANLASNDGTTTESNTVTTVTNADLPSKPYLLNVWGSWCIACSREHPLLMQLQQQGIDIVGINYKDDAEFAMQYLQDEGNPYTMNIHDEEGDLGIDLGLTGAPETFVVDGNGIIRQHIVGEITQDSWQASIEPCLNAVKTGDDEQVSQMCQ